MGFHAMDVREADYCEDVYIKLWAEGRFKEKIAAIDKQGSPRDRQTRPLMFEARTMATLLDAGLKFDCEARMGLGNSDVDILIHGEPRWLIELVATDELPVSPEVTVLAKDKNGAPGLIMSVLMKQSESPDPEHPRNPDKPEDPNEGTGFELIKLRDKILEKVCKQGREIKFPSPSAGTYHAILVDARGFDGGFGPTKDDMHQLIYGSGYANFPDTFRGQPIIGVFTESSDDKPLKLMREKVHLIGLCNETKWEPGALGRSISWFINPFLEGSAEAAARLPVCLMAEKGHLNGGPQ